MSPTEHAALRDIRGYASANRIIISRHAYRRMEERGATEEDVLYALARAEECVAQQGGRYRVQGRDQDGDALCLIVTVEDGVVVITVFGGD